MTCSTDSNGGKFAWSGIGIGEGTTLKGITFRLSDFFNKGLEHESGFFIATLRIFEFSAYEYKEHSQITSPHVGVLPSLFNTANYLEYVGPYLVHRFYGADYMSGDERAKFLEWNEEQREKIFCNKQEHLAYCTDDVNVLREACCAFRNLFLKMVKMDPFRLAITLSSISNKVLRTMILKPDTRYYPERGVRNGRTPVC